MLALCGQAFEPVWTDFAARVTWTPEWRRVVNPMGEIPVLEENGVSLTQTGPILLRLAERYGQFAGADEAERFEVLRSSLGIARRSRTCPCAPISRSHQTKRATISASAIPAFMHGWGGSRRCPVGKPPTTSYPVDACLVTHKTGKCTLACDACSLSAHHWIRQCRAPRMRPHRPIPTVQAASRCFGRPAHSFFFLHQRLPPPRQESRSRHGRGRAPAVGRAERSTLAY